MWFLQFSCVLIAFVQLSQPATIEHRIVNGEKVSIDDYPYQVYLFNPSGSCGGSIISKKCILTAGHCVVKPDLTSIKTWAKHNANTVSVLPGKSNVLDKSSAILAEKINLHSDFNIVFLLKDEEIVAKDVENDIAIIFLGTSLICSTGIKKVSLPPLGESESLLYGKTAVATGYGRLYDNKLTKDLYAVNLKIPKTNILCENDKIICLPKQENSRGTCFGDSGGPLVINGVQYGIISGANNKNVPPLCQYATRLNFINIIHYREWISKNSDVYEANALIGEGNGIDE
ncbi:chymotrypsin-2-like [Anthonomus grandis grandis]|uniref:chymotrypsin-2-like n=1 Tax=Anthonomus grandis grandis TaxID=2921223 RepID=UPI002166AA43|nr:chymotrypsin-2-like [Anthonomus grandis grandis]